MNDEELIQSFYNGDREALSVIFARHKEGVFNFALRMLTNRADAEDVTSDVFGRLCGEHGRFRPDASFKTWLYTIARNSCLDRMRNRRNWASTWFKKQDSQDDVQMDFPSQDPSPSQDLQSKETAHYIRSAIQALPNNQREALVLREYEDLSYEEISKIIGCSLANVKVLIYRARVQLKDTIPAYIKEGR
jgi:RNA polymerase sigma-70 factor (ECF subfamily)